MAPVVRIEPNDSQTLLLFDNALKDLENSGWLVFIQRFEGFNIFFPNNLPSPLKGAGINLETYSSS